VRAHISRRRVEKVKVSSDAGQGSRGHIRERVANAGNVVNGGRSRASEALAHGKALEQTKGDRGGAATGHASGPSNGRRVIAANSDLDPLHGWPEVSFKSSLVKEHSCHFEV
jgi:hypothetical protein